MNRKFLARVDRQVVLLLGVVLFLFAIQSFMVSTSIYHHSINEGLTKRVNNIHKFIEHQIEPNTFQNINSKKDMEKECYIKLQGKMAEVRAIADLRYIYTAKRTTDGQLVYVVDGLSEDASDFRYPGDPIEEEIQPELERALSGEVVLPEKILDTEWGNIFIAYFPLHDADGNIAGALGIEVGADVEAGALRKLVRSITVSCIFFCFFAFVTAIFVFRRISNPLYKDMANTDFMTNLKNRNAYETDIGNLYARKKTEQFAVAVIDINNLKLANDQLGHDVGDGCITEAGRLLRACETDKITAYRYGGDEFVVLMENHPNPEALLEWIRQEFKKYGGNLKIPVALAIGYAVFDKKLDSTLADTQKRADALMYRDKMQIKKAGEKEK